MCGNLPSHCGMPEVAMARVYFATIAKEYFTLHGQNTISVLTHRMLDGKYDESKNS